MIIKICFGKHLAIPVEFHSAGGGLLLILVFGCKYASEGVEACVVRVGVSFAFVLSDGALTTLITVVPSIQTVSSEF